MPKDGSDTRQRLLEAAEGLFAEKGIWQVSTGEIVRAAGQRNASALSYHFGPRDKVLEAVLIDHGDPIDARRAELRAQLNGPGDVEQFVGVLVSAIAPCLDQARGRRYLQIVDQVSGLTFSPSAFEAGMPPNLRSILAELRAALEPGVPLELHQERLKAMVMLMTASLADRVRLLDSGVAPALDHRTYVANLVGMLVGVLCAPVAAASSQT